jgi:hypothetical protein
MTTTRTLATSLSLLALGLIAVAGCRAKTEEDDAAEELGETEAQVVLDDEEADGLDQDLEVGLDEPLSGAAPAEPAAPPDAATQEEVLERARTNPGLFFQPAGCIQTTVSGNVATHVFTGCTGPHGLASFNGTVTSTYVLEAGKLTITHEATDFSINQATVSGKRVVAYSREGTKITRVRTGSWSGTTGQGNPITHEANFTATFDVAAKCITREGSATTSIGGRALSRTLTNYERCGIGRLGCPNSGTLVLARVKDGVEKKLTIEFLGGRTYRVTGPNGNSVERQLACREGA